MTFIQAKSLSALLRVAGLNEKGKLIELEISFIELQFFRLK
jgi:hypothetical protein